MKAGRENKLTASRFECGGKLPGLGTVARVLRPCDHSVAVANFFFSPSADQSLDEEEDQILSPKD